MSWAFNRNYDDLEQVAEFYPAYLTARAEIMARVGYPYNDEFRGKIPGITGERKSEDTAIYLLQGLYRQREMDARLAAWLADGWRPVESVPAVTKFARVILYKADRSGKWHQYEDARLVPETKPHQVAATGPISALLPKGKRTSGVAVGSSGYAVLVKG